MTQTESALSRSEVTECLDAWSQGDPDALSQLMPLVVDDLRRIAAKYLSGESPTHTLQPTALVNEVYLRLVGRQSVRWKNREQFFAFSAEIMRRILVDHARRKSAARHGGEAVSIPFDDTICFPHLDTVDLLALDEALERLEAIDPRQRRIVELRFFTGLTLEETAEVLGVSSMTVKREWRTAKLWLCDQLS